MALVEAVVGQLLNQAVSRYPYTCTFKASFSIPKISASIPTSCHLETSDSFQHGSIDVALARHGSYSWQPTSPSVPGSSIKVVQYDFSTDY